MSSMKLEFLIGRVKPAAIHLSVSAAVAAFAALLVFRVWYPSPFDQMAGGVSLFMLLVSVDVVMGPALTLVAADPAKPRTEFRRDLAVIIALQAAAFGYGIHTIALARPVYESFEVDRFRIVTAADIEIDELGKAPANLRELSWQGPRVIAAVRPHDPEEQLKAIELGLAGIELSMLPSNWRPYAAESPRAWSMARPVALLSAKYPEMSGDMAHLAAASGSPVGGLRFLPVLSRQVSWVAIVAPPDARVVGHLPVGGFLP